MNLRSREITILMPCKDQRRDFLTDALRSVLDQTSPDWRLIVVIDAETPSPIKRIFKEIKDERIVVKVSDIHSFGGALNTGMKAAETEYVCILLSDDRLDLRAVETLQRYIKKFPRIDFFHSSRRHIDANGILRGPILRSRRGFQLDDFKKTGSPVKHLMCWRRAPALEMGGMDESLSLVCCDDYDFPWRMAEAGMRFKGVDECLYYYRVHHEFPRLTTHVPLAKQIELLRSMFRKHGVTASEMSRYIQKALKGYLVKSKFLTYDSSKNYQRRLLKVNL